MNILQHLDPLELLVAMRINKTARALITEDPALIEAMGCKASTSGYFFVSLGGRKLEQHQARGIDVIFAQPYRTLARQTGYTSGVHMVFSRVDNEKGLSLDLTKVQGVGRAMLLSQPMVQHATVRLVCEHAEAAYTNSSIRGAPRRSNYYSAEDVRSHNGVTIGDVSDAAKRLLDKHAQQRLIRQRVRDDLSWQWAIVVHRRILYRRGGRRPKIAGYKAKIEEEQRLRDEYRQEKTNEAFDSWRAKRSEQIAEEKHT